MVLQFYYFYYYEDSGCVWEDWRKQLNEGGQ